jgi:tetratricopeptide (TPR) repeat protein
MNLRNKLNAIEKQRKEPIPVRKTTRTVNIKYAAAIAAFIVIGSIALLSNRKLTNDEILDRYYKPYEAASTSRSGVMVRNTDYNFALDYYKIRDYRTAAIYFNKVLETDPGNMQSELLNGISNFEIQNYPEAKGSFSKVIVHKNNYYIDHAQWYLALCYIRTDEKTKAIEQLAIIEKSKTIYRKEARKIRKSLN